MWASVGAADKSLSISCFSSVRQREQNVKGNGKCRMYRSMDRGAKMLNVGEFNLMYVPFLEAGLNQGNRQGTL